MFVKPAEGRAPRCPYTNMRIPAEGLPYPDHDPHISTLLRFGDVVEAEPPVDATASAAPAPDAPAPAAPSPSPDAPAQAAAEPAAEEH